MTTAIDRAHADASLPFGDYASVYDLIYREKDYAAEARFVADLIVRFGARAPGVARIVDLACGTGRHAVELARLGFSVEGSDISEAMLRIARKRAMDARAAIAFHRRSFQTCGLLGKRFDVALAMFGSLGYLTNDVELALALANVSRLLVPRGIFVFDVWNGAAVERDFAPQRVKRAAANGFAVERVSTTAIDASRQIATIRFEFVLRADDGTASSFEELHSVRFHHPDALAEILRLAGFVVLHRCPFRVPERDVGPDDWNMTFVVRHPS
jgi:SAM-dependent methyltransferase